MPNERRILLALFSIAFGVRILYAVLFGSDPGINPNPITPAVTYSFKIASGSGWFSKPFSPQAPGYPMFLGLIFALGGKHITLAIVAQAVLGGILAVLGFFIGNLLGGFGVGLLSSVWIALYAHLVYFSALLVRDILSCLLFTALALILSLPLKRMRYSLLAGVVYAYLLHVDPQFFFIFPFIVIFILGFVARYLIMNLQYLFLFTTTVIILLVPWTVRNYQIYKQFIPVSLETSRYLSPVKRKIPAKIRDIVQKRSPAFSPSRAERMKKNAVEFWRVIRWGEEARTTHTEPPWSLRHNLLSLISYGVLLPFFLIAMVDSFRKRSKVGILLALFTLSYFLIRLVFGGSERSRLQVEPFIIILAFHAIINIKSCFRRVPQTSS